jgi:hypothetical protein
MGTGHASTRPNVSAAAAIAHYENTGSTVADVAAGEDEFGIWVAGALRPSVTAEQIRELRGGSLSGDWRNIKGSLEMVAALAVNVPGFPVPRIQASLAASGTQMALVAAGIDRDGCGCGSEDLENRLAYLERLVKLANLENVALDHLTTKIG